MVTKECHNVLRQQLVVRGPSSINHCGGKFDLKLVLLLFFPQIALAIGVLTSNRRGGWLPTMLVYYFLFCVCVCLCLLFVLNSLLSECPLEREHPRIETHEWRMTIDS